MSRRAGTVVLTGLAAFGTTVTLSQLDLAIRGRTVHSCQNGKVRMSRDIPRFVKMMEDGLVDATPILSRRYPLEEINEAARAADAREVLSSVIIP